MYLSPMHQPPSTYNYKNPLRGSKSRPRSTSALHIHAPHPRSTSAESVDFRMWSADAERGCGARMWSAGQITSVSKLVRVVRIGGLRYGRGKACFLLHFHFIQNRTRKRDLKPPGCVPNEVQAGIEKSMVLS